MKIMELITKVSQTIHRQDGSSVRITATEFDGLFGSSIGVDVFRQENENSEWELCSDQPKPGWKQMSR